MSNSPQERPPRRPNARLQYFDRRSEKFLLSKTGHRNYGVDWVGAKKLGRGGFGVAGLWVKIDSQTQCIVDRIAIKECCPRHDKFHDPAFYKGGLYETPLEAYHNYVVQGGCDNIIQLHAHSVNIPSETYRLYMEYCAERDLHKRIVNAYDPAKTHSIIPEPFLWRLFRDLAVAAVAMEHPDTSNADHVLVHMDLKEDNIFLQSPDQDEYPKYPVAKIADFGAAILTEKSDAKNFEKVTHAAHTPGYDPPETYARNFWVDKGGSAEEAKFEKHIVETTPYLMVKEKVLGSANIWQIGLIISKLMRKKFDSEEMAFNRMDLKEWVPDLSGTEYSRDLQILVRICMHPSPSRRVTGSQLLEHINHKIARHVDVMNDARCLQAGYNGQHDLLPISEEHQDGKAYNIGENAPSATPARYNPKPTKAPGHDKIPSILKPGHRPQDAVGKSKHKPPGRHPALRVPESRRPVAENANRDSSNRLPSILRPGPRPASRGSREARGGVGRKAGFMNMAELYAAMSEGISPGNTNKLSFTPRNAGGHEELSVDEAAQVDVETPMPNSEMFMEMFRANAPRGKSGNRLRRAPAVRGRRVAAAPEQNVGGAPGGLQRAPAIRRPNINRAPQQPARSGANAGAARRSNASSIVEVGMEDAPASQARRMGPVQRGGRNANDIAQAQRLAGARRAAEPIAFERLSQPTSSGAGRPRPAPPRISSQRGVHPIRRFGRGMFEAVNFFANRDYQ